VSRSRMKSKKKPSLEYPNADYAVVFGTSGRNRSRGTSAHSCHGCFHSSICVHVGSWTENLLRTVLPFKPKEDILNLLGSLP
jgi:hypothetical protein